MGLLRLPLVSKYKALSIAQQLKVPTRKVNELVRELNTAISKLSPENVERVQNKLICFLQKELFKGEIINVRVPVKRPKISESRNLSDAISMDEALEALKSGPLNLPGGGTIQLTDCGIDIKGPVNLKRLERFSNGKKGKFYLKNLRKFNLGIGLTSISITTVKGNGFNKNKEETENLVGGAHKLPTLQNIALVMFAIQFLPEFRAKYNDSGFVGLRTNCGDVFLCSKYETLHKTKFDNSCEIIGTVIVS